MEFSDITRPVNAFQKSVPRAALERALGEALPNTRLLSVRELEGGLFNNSYHVVTDGGAYVLKVAPGPETEVLFPERFLMQREAQLAARIEQVSPLVPRYHAFFLVDGRQAFLQAFAQGRLWAEHMEALSDNENQRLWTELGRIARQFHDQQGDAFGYPAPHVSARSWSAFIERNVEGLVSDCEREGVMCDAVGQFARLLPHFRERLDVVDTPRLLHGDLWPRNVLIDGQEDTVHISAIIDAERAFWGDPVSDWVLILYGVPQAFWEGYGECLIETQDPFRIALYEGMYFIQNIVECTRFDAVDDEYRERLQAVNAALSSAPDFKGHQ